MIRYTGKDQTDMPSNKSVRERECSESVFETYMNCEEEEADPLNVS